LIKDKKNILGKVLCGVVKIIFFGLKNNMDRKDNKFFYFINKKIKVVT